MIKKIRTNYIAILLTNVCTLRCKLCTSGIPCYKQHEHTELSKNLDAIDKLFDIYEHIGTIDLSGGETLTYPYIIDVVKECLKFGDKVDNIRIITNGTIIPSEDLLKLMASDDRCIFMVDDYGELSTNLEKVISLIKEYNIRLKLNLYRGDEQLYDGWVDLGDFSDRGYDEKALSKVFGTCHSAHWMCLAMKNGKLHQCSHSIVADELGYCKFNEKEGVDLLDDNISTESKIDRASKFGKVRISACKLCNGFDSENGARFPAAEQI